MTLVNSTLLNSSFISNFSFGKPQKPEGTNNLLLRRIICPIRCNATTTTTNVNASERKSANYQPNLWNYDFLQSLKCDHAVIKLSYIYIASQLDLFFCFHMHLFFFGDNLLWDLVVHAPHPRKIKTLIYPVVTS